MINISNILNILGDTSIDIKSNSVDLSVVDIEEFNRALYERDIVLPDNINLIEVNSLITSNSLYGGLALNNGSCTAGFGVKHSSGTKGIVTAAHCDDNQFFEIFELTFVNYKESGSADLQWHTAPDLTIENDVKTGSFFGVTTWRNMTGTVSRSNQCIGEVVCKYGQSTGYGCGEIVSTSVKPGNITNANATFIGVSKNGQSLTAIGDSGGPWFSGNNAYGVHMGGGGGGSNMSVYTPINFLSVLGLSILTN